MIEGDLARAKTSPMKLRTIVKDAMAKRRIAQGALANQLGLAQCYLSMWINAKEMSSPREPLYSAALERWVNDEKYHRARAVPAKPRGERSKVVKVRQAPAAKPRGPRPKRPNVHFNEREKERLAAPCTPRALLSELAILRPDASLAPITFSLAPASRVPGGTAFHLAKAEPSEEGVFRISAGGREIVELLPDSSWRVPSVHCDGSPSADEAGGAEEAAAVTGGGGDDEGKGDARHSIVRETCVPQSLALVRPARKGKVAVDIAHAATGSTSEEEKKGLSSEVLNSRIQSTLSTLAASPFDVRVGRQHAQRATRASGGTLQYTCFCHVCGRHFLRADGELSLTSHLALHEMHENLERLQHSRVVPLLDKFRHASSIAELQELVQDARTLLLMVPDAQLERAILEGELRVSKMSGRTGQPAAGVRGGAAGAAYRAKSGSASAKRPRTWPQTSVRPPSELAHPPPPPAPPGTSCVSSKRFRVPIPAAEPIGHSFKARADGKMIDLIVPENAGPGQFLSFYVAKSSKRNSSGDDVWIAIHCKVKNARDADKVAAESAASLQSKAPAGSTDGTESDKPFLQEDLD